MKVLVITPGFLPVPAVEGGAIEVLVDDYAKYHHHSIDLVIYTPSSSKITENMCNQYPHTTFRFINKNKQSYKVNRLMRGIWNHMFPNRCANAYLASIIKDLKSRREMDMYDAVIVENMGSYVLALQNYFPSKILFHLHNDYLNKNTYQGKEIVAASSSIYGVSQFICDRINEITEEAKEKTNVLYNGIDLSLFNQKVSKEKVDAFQKKYTLPKDSFTILYTGRLMEGKGVDKLILAFQNFYKKYSNSSLLIIGGARAIIKNEDSYVQKLKELASGNSSILFTGKMNRDALSEAYAVADVQVVPSMCNEAFGLTVIEGMASSKALIVSNDGAIPEIIEQDTAIIVDRENLITEIESALIDLYNDQEKRAMLSKKAFIKSKEFSNKQYVQCFDDYILKFIKNKK